MVDVPLRHRRGPAADLRRRKSRWLLPLIVAAGAVAALVVAALLLHLTIDAYRERWTLTGLTDDPSLVVLAIGGERLEIPANMIRYAETRRGGPVERAELIIHWPTLEGYSDPLSDDFTADFPAAPIVFATIAARDSALDSTERLDEVYARFFTGKALAGPGGLVGRALSADSGYGGEVVFFSPGQPHPFVARCLAEETPQLPATCLRDIKFGRGLSLLYRFDRDLLDVWPALDAGLRRLAEGFLARQAD